MAAPLRIDELTTAGSIAASAVMVIVQNGATVQKNVGLALSEITHEVWLEQYGGSPSATAAVNSQALSDAQTALPNGGTINIGPGVFEFNTFNITVGKPLRIKGSGVANYSNASYSGTELRSTLRDGATPAIFADGSSGVGGNDLTPFTIEDLVISGGTYTEIVTGNLGQGGTALNNFVGLHIKLRNKWCLRNVQILGFKFDGLRLEDSIYGAAYNCTFRHNTEYGVKATSGNANAITLYSCHFQYNTFGTLNIRKTIQCTWEGQWRSAALYNSLGIEAEHIAPYFELNMGANTSGDAEILSDTTNYAAVISLRSPYFASGSTYSARANPTHLFAGRCDRLIMDGAARVYYSSPQLHPLFKLVGAMTFTDRTEHPSYIANYATFTTGEVKKSPDLYIDAVVAGGATSLEHYAYNTLRITATGAVNLDNIATGFSGQLLKLVFGDGNVTVRHNGGGGGGNIRLAGSVSFVGDANDTMMLIYDPNAGGLWKEVSRAANT